jgi:hypothetical protein
MPPIPPWGDSGSNPCSTITTPSKTSKLAHSWIAGTTGHTR